MDIAERLKAFISQEVLRDPSYVIGDDEPLISGGLIDSFGLVDVALFVEGQFGVRIEDTELNADTFDTINELAALIASRQPQG
jgi:acyl carrier protein